MDLLPPERKPLDAPERAPDLECPPTGEREARNPPDRAARGELDVGGPAASNPESPAATKPLAAELSESAVFGLPIDAPPLSRQIPPGSAFIPNSPPPAAQLPLVAPAVDPIAVLAVIPKLPFPGVQLEAPPLTPAGFAPDEFGPVLDEVALVLCWCPACSTWSWLPVCCICACIWAIPAQDKKIAAKIALKIGLPVFAPLTV